MNNILEKAAGVFVSDKQGNRINNFNILKLLSAAMVIYGHMCHIMGVSIHCVYGQAVSSIAVKILFVISGYLITKSFNKDNHIGRYLTRRFFRIFPGLIGVVFFAVFIVGPLCTTLSIRDYFASYGTWLYLKNIILYPIYSLPGTFGDYTYPNAVNGSLWTLPIEFALYLIIPPVILLFKKLNINKGGSLVLAIAFVVLDYLKIVYFPTARTVVYGTNWVDAIAIIPYFFVGSFFSNFENKKIFNLQIAVVLMFLLGVFKLSEAKCEVLLCFILPYFVLSFAFSEKPVFSKVFEKSEISYGLYLYGFVVQQVIYHQLQKTGIKLFSLNITFIICFIATAILAYISYFLVEKPLQKIGDRLIEKSLKRKNLRNAD